MSRIIVKNLPKCVTENELKDKFGEKGTITDVQLKYTKDGKFRQFGFVGYSSENEASAAVDYFDKSFFKSSRISVEKCVQLGDEQKPKSWSKYATDSTAYKKLNKSSEMKPEVGSVSTKEVHINPLVKELASKLAKYKNDADFLEYMEVHGKDTAALTATDMESFLLTHHGKSILDKSNNADSGVEDEEYTEDGVSKIANDKTVSDLDYLKLKTGKVTLDEVYQKDAVDSKYFTLVVRGIPYKTKKKDIKDFFKPLKVDSIRIPIKIKGMAYVGFKDEKIMKKALLRDKSFINGKRILIYQLKENVDHQKSAKSNIPDKWKKQEDSFKNEEDVAESGRIFIRNLPYTTTEAELQPIFEKYGPVTEIIVPLDKLTRKIKGFGVVTFLMPEHAVKAYTELDGSVFHGRMLHLLPGKAKESNEPDVHEKSSFKTKKMQSLKAEAGSSYNWNTLFLGMNAVADIIASSYNTTKKEVLSGDNAAVRLALGETQLVQETKEFLELNGVKLDAFNRAVNHRSKNVILVKNLPAGTRLNEIHDIFVKHGVLGRVVLPPSGITCIVEFLEPAEARAAFRKLAYSRFKHMPLYLEWAPDDTFVNSYDKDAAKLEKEETKEVLDDDSEPEPDTTLFIKNLNFETSDDAIREHFKDCGKIASVTVAKKKDPKNPGCLMSMGYGFIQFYTQKAVNNALKTRQQTMLDNHCIELKRSNRTLKESVHVDRKTNNVGKQTGTKILIRNVPFQAKLKELQELFKVFGDIKALRLPKKMVGTGPHRGFAFVEYYTKEEAKSAMKSLCQSTHLYGRRLVLEWAQSAEEDIEQMRKRTAERFKTDKEIRSKKSTADIRVGEDKDDDGLEMNNDAMFEEGE